MMRTLGDMARLLSAGRDRIKSWVEDFGDNLSEHASPLPGKTRRFTELDARVLALINQYWDDEEPDLEPIRAALARGEQHSEGIVEFVHSNTPIFQETPDDIDETWTHGVILSSTWVRPMVEVARSYKYAADELVKEALSFGEPHLLDYPIVFNYRHAIELYLKLILNDPQKARDVEHNLGRLIEAVEAKIGKDMNEWTRSRLNEFHHIDPYSDRFRYADRAPQHQTLDEVWIDFRQLKSVMDRLCDMFEAHIFRGGN